MLPPELALEKYMFLLVAGFVERIEHPAATSAAPISPFLRDSAGWTWLGRSSTWKM
jgi:hypothetical protein